MSYLAYSNRSSKTGSLLASVLQIASGETPDSCDDKNILIRWGSSASEQADEAFDKVFNRASAIASASDKMFALSAMREAGVRVPDFDTEPEALIERVGYPVMGRNRNHARGTDIKLILQKKDYYYRSHHYTEYIPTKREFRIHVVRGEVIRVQGKYMDIPSKKLAHIRNYETGYRFRAPRQRLRQDRLDAAVKSVECLGLDFGAVDLIVADNDECYVLEVNTAPSCSPLTLGAYAVALSNLTGIEPIDMSVLELLDRNAEEMDSDDEEGDN